MAGTGYRKYSRFCDLYIDWRRRRQHQRYASDTCRFGEKLFVDCSRRHRSRCSTVATGEERRAHIFTVAVLRAFPATPARRPVGAKGLPTGSAHTSMRLRLLGGAPKLLVCDEFACRSDRSLSLRAHGINRTYQEMATHYPGPPCCRRASVGRATRPRSRSRVLIVERFILARLLQPAVPLAG